MSIASAIATKQQQIADSYTAVSNKGGTLPTAQNLTNLATAISSIPSGGGSEKYGANIDTFIGDVDVSGVLQTPTEQYDLVFTGVKDVASMGFYYRFMSLSSVKSASFPDLEQVSGNNACASMFQGCKFLTSISLPNLTTISGGSACSYMFYNTALTSVPLPNLTTISGSSACAFMFVNCLNLTDIYFPALTTISGSSACNFMFQTCRNLTDIYFPALTTSSFGSYTNQFNYMMYSTGNTTTHTIHFPSNLQSTISGLTGYPLFGGTSGYVVCAFDLPSTQ